MVNRDPPIKVIGQEAKCTTCKWSKLVTERVVIDPWGELHYRQDHPATELPDPFDRVAAYCSSPQITGKTPRRFVMVMDCEAYESRSLETPKPHHCWNWNEHAWHGGEPGDGFGHVVILDSNRTGMDQMRARQVDTKAECIVSVSAESLRLLTECPKRSCDGYVLEGKCLKCEPAAVS